MSAYTISWETYRSMQDRIEALEKLNTELSGPIKTDYATATEMILIEAEHEIDRLRLEIKKLKGE
jgi:hypothetical protein